VAYGKSGPGGNREKVVDRFFKLKVSVNELHSTCAPKIITAIKGEAIFCLLPRVKSTPS